jgi:hypothetical protein
VGEGARFAGTTRGYPGEPIIEVTFDGDWKRSPEEKAQLEAEISRRIISVRLLETDVGADECEFTLQNNDLALLEHPFLLPNVHLRVRLTDTNHDGGGIVRSFTVVEWRGLRPLMVRCLSRYEWALNRSKKPRTYESSRISDIVKAIADRHNLDVQLESPIPSQSDFATVDVTPAAHTKKTQTSQSDAQFLKALAEEIGFVWYIEERSPFLTTRNPHGATLFFHERRFKPSNSAEEVNTYEVGNDPRIIGDPIFDMNLGRLVRRLTADIYDPLEKKYRTLVADIGTTSRRVLGKSSPIDADSEWRISTSSDNLLSLGEELNGLFREFERNMIKVKLPLRGDPFIRPKRLLYLTGLGKLLDGPYYIDSIEYKVGGGQPFTSMLQLRRNAMGFTAGDLGNAIFALEKIREQFQQKVKAARDLQVTRARKTPYYLGPVTASGDPFNPINRLNAMYSNYDPVPKSDDPLYGTWDAFGAEVP